MWPMPISRSLQPSVLPTRWLTPRLGSGHAGTSPSTTCAPCVARKTGRALHQGRRQNPGRRRARLMFIQVHTLRDYAVALPNRGQDGLAKRAPYGGFERQRISSQSIKAAMRDSTRLVRTGSVDDLVIDTLA